MSPVEPLCGLPEIECAEWKHFQWLATHFHGVTTFADTKAGAILTLQGVLIATTFNNGDRIVGFLQGESIVHAWRSIIAIAWTVFILASGASMGLAFQVLRPRILDNRARSKTPIFYYADLGRLFSRPRNDAKKKSRFSPGTADGGAWLAEVANKETAELSKEFANDVITMAEIARVKHEWARLALFAMSIAVPAWILAAGFMILASVIG